MALTKTPIELSSTPGIVDNSNATAITIDSSENVGLGVTPEAWHSVFKVLRVGTGSSIAGESGGTSTWFNTNAYYDGSWKRINQNTSAQIAHTSDGKQEFKVAASGSANSAISWNTAMTVDNSGNLLVGKTATDNTTAGTRIHPAGYASFTIANDYPIIANRLSSDGDIAVFRKDGTTVGAIGTNAATMYVSAPQAGGMKYSYLDSTNAVMLPVTTTGANADGLHDLGLSTARFRDLYITGLDVTYSTYNKISSYFSGSYTSGFKFSDLNGGIWYDAGTDDLTVSAGHANSQLILESGGSTSLTLDSDNNAAFSGDITSSGQIIGGFGASGTGGTLDWNHATNARSGMGYSLLLGTATNGMGGNLYYHVVNYEYGDKDGTGNITQLAIPYYGSTTIYSRIRYQGGWSSWGTV
jgi:hypothetical protein